MDVFVNEKAYNNKFPHTSAGKHRYKETEEGQEIMCEIMERINNETRNEINALTLRLIKENRLDDLRRAAEDADYQEQLLQELFPERDEK